MFFWTHLVKLNLHTKNQIYSHTFVVASFNENPLKTRNLQAINVWRYSSIWKIADGMYKQATPPQYCFVKYIFTLLLQLIWIHGMCRFDRYVYLHYIFSSLHLSNNRISEGVFFIQDGNRYFCWSCWNITTC